MRCGASPEPESAGAGSPPWRASAGYSAPGPGPGQPAFGPRAFRRQGLVISVRRDASALLAPGLTADTLIGTRVLRPGAARRLVSATVAPHHQQRPDHGLPLYVNMSEAAARGAPALGPAHHGYPWLIAPRASRDSRTRVARPHRLADRGRGAAGRGVAARASITPTGMSFAGGVALALHPLLAVWSGAVMTEAVFIAPHLWRAARARSSSPRGRRHSGVGLPGAARSAGDRPGRGGGCRAPWLLAGPRRFRARRRSSTSVTSAGSVDRGRWAPRSRWCARCSSTSASASGASGLRTRRRSWSQPRSCRAFLWAAPSVARAIRSQPDPASRSARGRMATTTAPAEPARTVVATMGPARPTGAARGPAAPERGIRVRFAQLFVPALGLLAAQGGAWIVARPAWRRPEAAAVVVAVAALGMGWAWAGPAGAWRATSTMGPWRRCATPGPGSPPTEDS